MSAVVNPLNISGFNGPKFARSSTKHANLSTINLILLTKKQKLVGGMNWKSD